MKLWKSSLLLIGMGVSLLVPLAGNAQNTSDQAAREKKWPGYHQQVDDFDHYIFLIPMSASKASLTRTTWARTRTPKFLKDHPREARHREEMVRLDTLIRRIAICGCTRR